MVLKITIRCQACGYTLRDYPVKGPRLPRRCPKCGMPEAFKEHRDVIYIPMINLRPNILRRI
jgi:predicted Zn-ribbon and HTH transcriptional regulator